MRLERDLEPDYDGSYANKCGGQICLGFYSFTEIQFTFTNFLK